ncbi:MAG: FAD-dependent oxidoreductase [Lutisporaceae bacterium]|jgi:ribulose 1,5-bisphosphate synthetase/thiazole synthase
MSVEQLYSDIVVVGGGMAGVVSAVAAARKGSNVILIEKGSCLGGNATAGMLGEINGAYHNGRLIVTNIGKEIIASMYDNCAIAYIKDKPMTSNPDILVDRLEYNSEYLKIVLDDLIIKEKIKVFFCSTIKEIKYEHGSVRIILANPYEEIIICSRILIDSTGNSECFFMLKEKTLTTDRSKIQAVSILFKLGGVKAEELSNMDSHEMQKIIQEGMDKSVLPAKLLSIVRIPHTNDIVINCTRCCGINHESIEDVSCSLINIRQQIKKIIPFIQNNVPGCKKAYLSSIAASLGVRDRRRIEGIYELTGEDIINCVKFEDSVAVGSYPIDIHSSSDKNNQVKFIKINSDGMYYIPYRSMLAKNTDYAIANGKCISADDIAFGGIRVIGTIINIATAAGIAASLAVLHKTGLKNVDISELKYFLKREGAFGI